MTSILAEICDKKRIHVDAMKSSCSLQDVKGRIDDTLPSRSFEQALYLKKKSKTPSVIAEVKKASPSKGVIRENFDPKSIAQNYDGAGATCISCLTDTPYFQGCDDYLLQVKSVTKLPVLRKDFMVDLYQIYESRALGADAILIIMAALDTPLAKDMYDLATDLGMSALFEVHNKAELDQALSLSPKILGVNNRNLKTLDVSLDTSRDLISSIPDGIIRISESGIASSHDVTSLYNSGYDGFLIGESLMNKTDESSSLRTLLNS